MKAKTIFYCTQCGNEFPKWQGQCPACGAWNTIVEQPAPAKGKGIVKPARAPGATHVPKRVSEMTFDQEIRFPTGLAAAQSRVPWFSLAVRRESGSPP